MNLRAHPNARRFAGKRLQRPPHDFRDAHDGCACAQGRLHYVPRHPRPVLHVVTHFSHLLQAAFLDGCTWRSSRPLLRARGAAGANPAPKEEKHKTRTTEPWLRLRLSPHRLLRSSRRCRGSANTFPQVSSHRNRHLRTRKEAEQTGEPPRRVQAGLHVYAGTAVISEYGMRTSYTHAYLGVLFKLIIII